MLDINTQVFVQELLGKEGGGAETPLKTITVNFNGRGEGAIPLCTYLSSTKIENARKN